MSSVLDATIESSSDSPCETPSTKSKKKLKWLSMKLSKLLRHTAVKRKLVISADGYVRVADILQLPEFKEYSLIDVRTVVKTNAKQRFRLKEDLDKVDILQNGDTKEKKTLYIRANQGHTISTKIIKTEDLLEKITLTNFGKCGVCVHGTYHDVYSKFISKDGLSRMKRNHIHFATRAPKHVSKIQESKEKKLPVTKVAKDVVEIISGARKDCDIFIFIDVEKALRDGYQFYLSSNDVVLCPGKGPRGIIPPRYFKSVISIQHNCEL
eukprot:g1594.t1